MLEINKINDKQHVIISLKGEVDASNSVELDHAIQEVLNDQNKKILVNGSELDYISSAGLGVFMSYLEDFEEKGVKFAIFGLNEKVYNVFHILGLDQLIPIREKQKDALEQVYEA